MVSDPKTDHCKWMLAWILSGWRVVDPAQMAVWISSEVSGSAPQLFRCRVPLPTRVGTKF